LCFHPFLPPFFFFSFFGDLLIPTGGRDFYLPLLFFVGAGVLEASVAPPFFSSFFLFFPQPRGNGLALYIGAAFGTGPFLFFPFFLFFLPDAASEAQNFFLQSVKRSGGFSSFLSLFPFPPAKVGGMFFPFCKGRCRVLFPPFFFFFPTTGVKESSQVCFPSPFDFQK